MCPDGEKVDTVDLKSTGEICEGSTPSPGILIEGVFYTLEDFYEMPEEKYQMLLKEIRDGKHHVPQHDG